jgi:hypothetical protein
MGARGAARTWCRSSTGSVGTSSSMRASIVRYCAPWRKFDPSRVPGKRALMLARLLFVTDAFYRGLSTLAGLHQSFEASGFERYRTIVLLDREKAMQGKTGLSPFFMTSPTRCQFTEREHHAKAGHCSRVCQFELTNRSTKQKTATSQHVRA